MMEDNVGVRYSSFNPGILDRRSHIKRRIMRYTLNYERINYDVELISVFVFSTFQVHWCGVKEENTRARGFIWRNSKLNFHGSGGLVGGPRPWTFQDDLLGLVLLWVTLEEFEEGSDAGDQRGGLLLGHQEAGSVVAVHDGCQGQFLADQLESHHLELKKKLRYRERYDIIYLMVPGVLILVPEYLGPPADCLDVRGGVRQQVEQGFVMIRAETKEQVNEITGIQGKYYSPHEDGSSRMTADTFTGHDMLGLYLCLEHVVRQAGNQLERGLAAVLVTSRKALTRYGQATLNVITSDLVNLLLDKRPQGCLLLGQLVLAGLESDLALLQSGNAGFGRRHVEDLPGHRFFSDKGGRKTTLEGNIYN